MNPCGAKSVCKRELAHEIRQQKPERTDRAGMMTKQSVGSRDSRGIVQRGLDVDVAKGKRDQGRHAHWNPDRKLHLPEGEVDVAIVRAR